jgi:hypothetical protein
VQLLVRVQAHDDVVDDRRVVREQLRDARGVVRGGGDSQRPTRVEVVLRVYDQQRRFAK